MLSQTARARNARTRFRACGNEWLRFVTSGVSRSFVKNHLSTVPTIVLSISTFSSLDYAWSTGMRKIISTFTFVVLGMLYCGCGETKEVTLYLQDLQVSGAVMNPPVHITDDPSENEIHIIPRIGVGSTKRIDGRIDGHTKVNRNGVFEVDTMTRSDNGVYYQDDGRTNTFTYEGKNLVREIPSYNLGFDLDFGLSKSIALSLGTNYSEIGGQGLWSYRAGLGLRSHKGSTAFRFDAGWQWEEVAFKALTVVTERPFSSSTSTVAFYSDRGKKNQGRFYASLVLNTVHREWPANGFLQIGLTTQKLDDIRPKYLEGQVLIPPFFLVPFDERLINDKRGTFSSTFIHIAPGVYFNIDEQIRFVAGVRVSIETQIEDRSSSTLVVPFVQFDFRF